MTESYSYDADGERVSVTRAGVTTYFFEGLWEETSGTVRRLYPFAGQVIAVREGATTSYLHGDQLGSVSVATSASGAVVSVQHYDPWGKVLAGGVPQARQNYTGQVLDQTGLLYYHARYYDPGIARFLSADTVVPGNASGGMGGIALKPLTVAFHEPGFNATLGNENDFGPWFTLSDKQKEQLGSPFGPQNPQSLNRYSYVLNNPMRWTDPSGHYYEKGGTADVGYETVCHINGVESACNAPHAQEVKVGGRTIVRIYVRNDDGTYSTKDVYQDSDEMNGFRTAAKDAEAKWSDVASALTTFGEVSAAAVAACAAAGAETGGLVCAAGIVAVLAVGAHLYYRQHLYNESKKAAYVSFDLAPGSAQTRRCRRTATAADCVG